MESANFGVKVSVDTFRSHGFGKALRGIERQPGANTLQPSAAPAITEQGPTKLAPNVDEHLPQTSRLSGILNRNMWDR
jgi:hypothetical protein